MQLISQTTSYSLSALVHEDVTYHRCGCSGLVHRGSHALISTLAAKTDQRANHIFCSGAGVALRWVLRGDACLVSKPV